MREHIYCECAFIDRLLESQPFFNAIDINSLERLDCWSNFCKLIQRSYLHIDISLKDIMEKGLKNKFYSLLGKRISNGELKVDESIFRANELSEHIPDYNGKYFVCKNKRQAEMLSKKYGVLVIPISDYLSYSFLFKDRGTPIKVNDENYRNWNLLKKKGSNICNSMMIIDNYLLNDKDAMDENLESILQSLLPEHLETIFQLSFFSFLYDQKSQSHRSLQKRYYDIMELIKKVRGEFFMKKVSLTIFKCQKYRFEDPKRFHGRVILTNNVFINCDGGYDLFKKGESRKLAIVNIVYPNLTDKIEWAASAFDDYLKEAKKESDVSEKYVESQKDISGRYLGDKNLRIWELLEESE